MIGIDTNVLVRFLTGDDAAQSAKASRFLSTLTKDDPGFVPLPVTLELMWVLIGLYGFSKQDVIHALDSLASTDELCFQHEGAIRDALHKARTSKLDLTDALVYLLSMEAGCDSVVTFDKKAARGGMNLL